MYRSLIWAFFRFRPRILTLIVFSIAAATIALASLFFGERPAGDHLVQRPYDWPIARSDAAESVDDTEPIVYGSADGFWAHVENVVRSKPWLQGTNNGPIDSRPGMRQTIEQDTLAMLSPLKGISMPRIQGLKRVRVFPSPHFPEESLLGFLVREDADAWTVFTSRWRIERVKRVKHARIEPRDLNDEIDAAVKLAQEIEKNTDGVRAATMDVPAELKDMHHRGWLPRLLFDMAYLAFASGHDEAVEPLLRAAIYQQADLLVGIYGDLAWRQFESAVLDLNAGAPRAGLSQRFERVAREFADSKFGPQASQYSQTLRQMAAENAARQPPKRPDKMTTDEWVRALIFELRNCAAVQDSHPGGCWIPSNSQPVEGEKANAADLLVAEGFDAVPALIEALADTRLTRSHGSDDWFMPRRYVLEVRDASIQTLRTIADDLTDRRLYYGTGTGDYFSNELPKWQSITIDRVNDWWAKARGKGEAAWLRERLRKPGQSRAMLLRRLVRIAGRQALPDVRQWLDQEKNYREYAYQLLLRAGGDAEAAELRALADPAAEGFEFAALDALYREHRLTKPEYTAALLAAATALSKREPGNLPVRMVVAMGETGDRRCALLLAEGLRRGKPAFDSATTAFSRIKDPHLGAEIAAYLLPFFDDASEAGGWRRRYQGKPDIYRVKDEAAFLVNRLLGDLLADFSNLTPPERDEKIDELRAICAQRGIRPAFELP